MLCPTCGCENFDDSTRCSVCGTELLESDNHISLQLKTKKKSIDKNKIIIISLVAAIFAVILVFAIILNQILIKDYNYKTKPFEYISADDTVVAVNDDGTVRWINPTYSDIEGGYVQHNYDLSDWSNIKTVAVGSGWVAGLKYDGTVAIETVRDKYYDEDYIKLRNEVLLWNDIVSISAGNDIIAGLKADGTVVTASSEFYSIDVSQLSDVIQIDVGSIGEEDYVLALMKDKTVETVLPTLEDYNEEDRELLNFVYDVSDWKDIEIICAGKVFLYAITSSGEFLTNNNEKTLNYYFNQYEYSDKDSVFQFNFKIYKKMLTDMIDRIEQLDVVQIVDTPDRDYFEWDLIENSNFAVNVLKPMNYIYLLLADGIVVVESPMLSVYYACKDSPDNDLLIKIIDYFGYDYYEDYKNIFEDSYYFALNSFLHYFDLVKFDEIKTILSNISLMNNIVAIDSYNDGCSNILIAVKSDGTICTNDEHIEINNWTGIKISEKSKRIEMGRIIDKTESDITTTIKKKEKASSTKPTTTKKIRNEKFYKDKYYLFADERGKLIICAFEIVDDYIVRVTYFEPPDLSNYTFVDAYYADRNGNYLYNRDLEFEFFIDSDSETVKYKDRNSSDYETLKEVNDLSESTLNKFLNEIT